MKVLLIGYGKMGTYILSALKKINAVTDICVCDSKFSLPFNEDGITFIPSIKDIDISAFNCAFIATPVKTHFEITSDLISKGMRNIYVEKPVVNTLEDYYNLISLGKGCRLVTGYILRQSLAANAMRDLIRDMRREGYRMKSCDVIYQKYLPTGSEERTLSDFGVDDDLVHVLDLMFIYLGYRDEQPRLTKNHIKRDDVRPERVLETDLVYSLSGDKQESLISISLSFLAIEKKREFHFCFINKNGEERIADLSFDNSDGMDRLVVSSNNGSTIIHKENPSCEKLDLQMQQVFEYFNTGELKDIAPVEESKYLLELMEQHLK